MSKEGTSKLVEAGDETAMDYGLKYALIAAGAERAGGAPPYGSPEGATALTAYTYELAGANGADRRTSRVGWRPWPSSVPAPGSRPSGGFSPDAAR